MTPSITLQEITAETVRLVTDLRVGSVQDRYVASPAVSIAQAYFHPEAWFRAVRADDELVGFVMLRDETLLAPPGANLSLWRLMIDHRHQGKGYGRAALALVAKHAQTRPGIGTLNTSYVPGPDAPENFYLKFGFRHTGQIKLNGEICLALDLSS